MTRLCWVLILTCFYSISEGTIIVKESGENIALKCSSEGCFQSNFKYAGMYLYHEFTERNEVYYYSNNDKITVRSKYKGRIWTNGTPMSHDVTITITNLTLDDSGVYTCVYKEAFDTSVKCNVYTVFVRVRAAYPKQGPLWTTEEERHLPGANHNSTEHPKGSCSTQKALLTTAEERSLPLVFIISIYAISTLFIIIFILLIIQRVKQRSICKRKARNSLQESNDYVYEVMMKTNVCPAAPEQSSQNPYEFN